MSTQYMTGKMFFSAALIAVSFVCVDTAYAGNATWTGLAGDGLLNTTGNWTAGGPPTTSGDVATWDGTMGGNLTLNYNPGFGSSPLGTTITITGGQTGSLLIGTDNGSTFSIQNITIASGAGAFTIGDGAGSDSTVFRNNGAAAPYINTLVNNSTSTATFATNVTFASGLGQSRTLVFAGSGNWEVKSNLVPGGSGSFAVTKNDAGTLTFTAANSYTGATAINGGTLKLQGAAFSTTARDYSIASNAVLNLDGNTGVATGTTTIRSNGTLRISGGGLSSGADGRDLTLALGSGALIEIESGASIYNGGWQNMTWTGNKAGMRLDGALNLSDGNTVIIDALTGTGTVTKSSSADTRTLAVGQNGGSGTFSGTITQASVTQVAALTKNGNGTQTLTGANNYSGATTINGGTLQIGDGGTNGTLGIAGVTIARGAFLLINRSDSYGTVANQSFSGAGTLIKEGAGSLVFNGSADHTSVQGITNVVVNKGLVRTDYWGKWNSNLNLIVNGSGIFELWNTSASLGTLNGDGTVQNTRFWGRSQTLTVAAGSFSGTITDSGVTSGGLGTGDTRISLVKDGAGTLTLSGTNTYGGTTTVSNGTLLVTGSISSTAGTTVTNGALFVNGSLAGSVSVASGATLGGTNMIAGAVTLASGAIFEPGAATNQIGTLTLSGTAPALSVRHLVADVSTTNGDCDKLVLTGTVDLTGLTVTVKIPGTLPDTNTYVLLSSTALSGTPTLAGDLSYPWSLTVKNNTLILSKVVGTMISFF